MVSGDPRFSGCATEGSVQVFLDRAAQAGLSLLVGNADDGTHGEVCHFANEAAANLLGMRREALLNGVIAADSFVGVPFSADDSWRSQGPKVQERLGVLDKPDGSRVRIVHTKIDCRQLSTPATVHVLRRSERWGGDASSLLGDEFRFRRLMDAAPDGIVVVSRTRVVYANQAMTRLCGYSHPRQLLQLSIEQLLRDHEQSSSFVPDSDEPASSLLARSELTGLRRDGSLFPVAVAQLPIDWDDSRAMLLTIRDLSARRQYRSRLAHGDRLAAVGTMAAGVAHEINNPLAYVLLNLQYLLREVPRLDEGSTLRAPLLDRLREAQHGVERVAAIVRDLRTFSKTEEERLERVDLHQVLRAAIRVSRTQLGTKGQIIEDFGELPPALGHVCRLEQVFLNLLVNAVQALPDHQAAKNEIVVRTRLLRGADGEQATVEISDTGVGIAPELVHRLFDPFFTTKPPGTGTGLGLPICHSIVTRLGGRISVESERGRGSTFLVSLPIASPHSGASVYPEVVSAIRLARRASILVVDDELAVAMILSHLLGENHEVVVATDGRQALDLLELRAFDVILCDLLMPEISGMDLYEQLQQRSPDQAARIAFMSGGAFTPRAAEFLSRVANPRIDKPFNLQAVRLLVEQIAAQNRNHVDGDA